ncbi:hypothetical protein ASE13_06275 [Sphingomonas sp. Root241]|nr:hypothetical protein ASE13_06275 [Sphingomonas sp. Root241]
MIWSDLNFDLKPPIITFGPQPLRAIHAVVDQILDSFVELNVSRDDIYEKSLRRRCICLIRIIARDEFSHRLVSPRCQI